MAVTSVSNAPILSNIDLNMGIGTKNIEQNSGFGGLVSDGIQGLKNAGHAYEAESVKALSGKGSETDIAIAAANLETSLKTMREALNAATALFKEIYHIAPG